MHKIGGKKRQKVGFLHASLNNLNWFVNRKYEWTERAPLFYMN